MAAFTQPGVVDLAWSQIVRAAREKQFEVLAYTFMPDHLHIVVEGMAEDSDLKAFAKLAKQYSGYYYAREHGGGKLWQKDSMIGSFVMRSSCWIACDMS